MLPEISRHSEKFYHFYEIANEGSLQAAARKLGLSAPSLSHAVKQLEEVTGVPLFHRHRSGVTLTQAGEQLFNFCRRYFRDLEDVQRSMEQSGKTSQRKIKIGTFQSIAIYFWPLLIDTIPAASPVSFSIMTNRSPRILEALLRHEVDVALTVETLKNNKLIHHELYKDEYAFYASRRWKRSEMKRSEVSQNSILFIPDAIDENGKSLRQYLHSWNLLFRDEFELDSLEVVSEFVKKGYGVGILPTKVAKTHAHDLKQIKMEGITPAKFGTHRFFLSYRNDLDLPKSLIEIILSSAKKASIELNLRAR